MSMQVDTLFAHERSGSQWNFLLGNNNGRVDRVLRGGEGEV